MKYLDLNGLRILVNKIKGALGAKADVSYVDNKVKTDVPVGAVFTDTKTDISGKADKTEIPKNVSELVNDSKYVTSDDLGNVGYGDMTKDIYDKNSSGIVDNAEKVNGFTVGTDVPADAIFTDTIADVTGKVDKVAGMGLSSNDYTDLDKREVLKIKDKADIADIPEEVDISGKADIDYVNNKVETEVGDRALLKTTDKSDMVGSMNELFTNVSNGKDLIAAAITDKEVPTSGSDTFSGMANNISNIETDRSGDATAHARVIRSGYTAYVKGNKITGNMPVRGTPTTTLTKQNQTKSIPYGYYNTGVITAKFSNLAPENVKKGVNIGGVVGSMEEGPRIISGEQRGTIIRNDSLTFTISDLPFYPEYVIVTAGQYSYGNYRYVTMGVNTSISRESKVNCKNIVREVSVDNSGGVRITMDNSDSYNNTNYTCHWVAIE